ncbi:50S ribosomal protein L11 methyltransferase [Paraliomyxa miuraensis]|uniref:50S ribosomal protein L11 methyltransferase n=1 Tax=Paraliomyxa miuraensis TaxID=376150 RepID=UPI002255C566|nr:50S ribosomal protein L11 methyltransferase [Paraliomyxa miuraensis]MCX4239563.1 50S ribosomal protein L11 methyltransferase [Paraliomyxa miuraensis]
MTEPWATVRIQLVRGADGALANDAVDRLDALGLLLADEPAVGGVERRDPGTLVNAATPEQWAYTTPPGVEAVVARALALAGSVGLRVSTEVEVHHDDDWRESWKRFYQPQVLGNGALLLRPSWVERRPGDPEREVILDPGRAFGTGLHESTRLCLRRLCMRWAEGLRPRTVLDLGCGSGILLMAAARLFPGARLWGVDYDPEAIETAEENAVLNELDTRAKLWVAPVDEMELGPTSELEPVELLLANIRPEVLVPSAGRLRGLLAPGGRVLLSGILVEEASVVRAAYQAVGLQFEPAADDVDGEWQAIELRAPP